MILSLGTPPPLTQHTAAKRPAAPTHECTGPASTGPRRIATEEKGRVSGTATGQQRERGREKKEGGARERG